MLKINEEAVFLSNKNVLSNINWNDTSELERLKAKYYDGFKAGVEFAQRWISVEDELPEDENKESDFSVCVLAKDMHGKTMSAYYHFKKYSFYSNAFSKSELIGITHWRPIELK